MYRLLFELRATLRALHTNILSHHPMQELAGDEDGETVDRSRFSRTTSWKLARYFPPSLPSSQIPAPARPAPSSMVLDCQLGQDGTPSKPRGATRKFIGFSQRMELARVQREDAKVGPDPWLARKVSSCSLLPREESSWEGGRETMLTLMLGQFAVLLVLAIYFWTYYVYAVRLCVKMVRMDSDRLGNQGQGSESPLFAGDMELMGDLPSCVSRGISSLVRDVLVELWDGHEHGTWIRSRREIPYPLIPYPRSSLTCAVRTRV
jgi:hypothetical protein